MSRPFLFKLIAILLGTLLAMLLAELAYRAWHFTTYEDLQDLAAGKAAPLVMPEQEVPLGMMVQLSKHPDIIYELIPSSQYRFRMVPVRTNSMGFKDKEYPRRKPKGAFRIIGLGDSVMFGWGVNEEDCYLTVLEDSLNKRQDSIQYEVINTGVPGYNTVMEVNTLAQKFDLEDVDMVIVHYVGNDLEVPNFIRKRPNYFGTKKSFILQRFKSRSMPENHLQDPNFKRSANSDDGALDHIPPEYRHHVGEKAYAQALEHLQKTSLEHGFKVLVLTSEVEYGTLPFVAENARRLGFDFLDVQPHWFEYRKTDPGAEWPLSKKDAHPSVKGHRLVAQLLLEKVVKK